MFYFDNKRLTTFYLKLISRYIALKRILNIEFPQNFQLSQIIIKLTYIKISFLAAIGFGNSVSFSI